MPARGDGLALLKWITSFPANPARGLPTVTGVVLLSDAQDGRPLMLLDARSVTALRTGAVAAVAARALARLDAATVGIVGCGCGPHGVWTRAWRPPATAGRVRRPARRGRRGAGLRAGLGGGLALRSGRLRRRACCVTPGAQIVIDAGDLRPGLHLNMLGADAAGKAEASIGAVSSCQLFCDEWDQASHGGELAGAVAAGLVTRDSVTELGAVLAGESPGPRGPRGRDAVRLHRPGDPGPGRGPRGAGGVAGGAG